MRIGKVLGALGAAVAVLLAGNWPAQGRGYYVTSQRWGSASAATGTRQAIVTLTEVRVTEDDPDQPPHPRPYACISLVDRAKGVSAATCVEAPFTIAADLQSAHAKGSARATIRRLGDGAAVGTTTLRYDVRWTAMTTPTPRVYGGARACPRLPWAAERGGGASVGTTAELVSFGWAVGTVSSATLGTVRYTSDTMTWYGGLGESVGEAVFTELPAAPVAVDPACYSVWGNVPAGRVIVE